MFVQLHGVYGGNLNIIGRVSLEERISIPSPILRVKCEKYTIRFHFSVVVIFRRAYGWNDGRKCTHAEKEAKKKKRYLARTCANYVGETCYVVLIKPKQWRFKGSRKKSNYFAKRKYV